MRTDTSTSKTPATPSGTEPAARRGGMVSFDDLERWFDEAFPTGLMAHLRRGWPTFGDMPELHAPFAGRWPKVDMVDRENDVLVHAELPGVKREDLDVSVTERSVTLKAKTSSETKDEKDQYFRREITRGEFERTLPLPQDIDTNAVQASLKDGVLELVLPKVKTTPRKSVSVS